MRYLSMFVFFLIFLLGNAGVVQAGLSPAEDKQGVGSSKSFTFADADDFQSAQEAVRILMKGAKVSEKSYVKLGEAFCILQSSSKTKDAHPLWRLLGALMMTGEQNFTALHDKIVATGYKKDNSLLSQIGYRWGSADEIQMNHVDNQILNSRLGMVLGDAQSPLTEFANSWKLTPKAKAYKPLEGFGEGAALYWSFLFKDPKGGNVISAQDQFETSFSSFCEPAEYSKTLQELMEMGRKLSEDSSGVGKEVGIKMLADLSDTFGVSKNIYLRFLFGGQKIGKTLISNVIKYVLSRKVIAFDEKNLAVLGLQKTYARESYEKSFKAMCVDHLVHTVCMHYRKVGELREIEQLNGIWLLLDSVGLGSSAIQGMVNFDDRKFYSVNECLGKLVREARCLEAFQTVYQMRTGANPIAVISQWDDLAAEMIAGFDTEEGLVVHNLRFATKEEIDAYKLSLKNLGKKNKGILESHGGKALSAREGKKLKIGIFGDRLDGTFSSNDDRLMHFVLGPLNTNDPELFEENLKALNGICDHIRRALNGRVFNFKKLASATIDAYKAMEADRVSGVAFDDSSEYPFLRSEGSKCPQYNLAVHDCSPGVKPVVSFDRDYKGDLRCSIVYKNLQRQPTSTDFVIDLNDSLKGRSQSLINELSKDNSSYVEVKKGGSISITLPDASGLAVDSDEESEAFYPLDEAASGRSTPNTSFIGSSHMNIPVNVKTMLDKTVGVEVTRDAPVAPLAMIDRRIAVEGDYNVGKTSLIGRLLGIESAGAEGNMVHTEGAKSLIAKMGNQVVEVRDTMGRNSGTLQQSAEGVTDEDVRRQQFAIRAAVAPENTDLTIYVTKAFDNAILKQLLEGGYDPTRTIVVHNMKEFTKDDVTETYMGRIRKFIKDLNEAVVGGTSQYDVCEDGDWVVVRQRNGMTHVFVKHFDLKDAATFNQKTINFLRSAIIKTPSRTAPQTLQSSMNAMMESMVHKAFALPVGASVTVENSGNKFTPIVKDKDGNRLKVLPVITPVQDSYGTAAVRQPLSYVYENLDSTEVNGSFEFRVGKLTDTMKLWFANTPTSAGLVRLLEALGCKSIQAFAELGNKDQQQRVENAIAFMNSLNDEVGREHGDDVENLIKFHCLTASPGDSPTASPKDAFCPLDYYKSINLLGRFTFGAPFLGMAIPDSFSCSISADMKMLQGNVLPVHLNLEYRLPASVMPGNVPKGVDFKRQEDKTWAVTVRYYLSPIKGEPFYSQLEKIYSPSSTSVDFNSQLTRVLSQLTNSVEMCEHDSSLGFVKKYPNSMVVDVLK